MSSDEIRAALDMVDASEKVLGAAPDPQEGISQVALTPEGFYLFKARTLVASPLKKLRAPDAAEAAITEALTLMGPDRRTDRNRRRSAYQQLESNIVLSQVYLDRDYYPIATTLAQDALKMSEKLGSTLQLQFVEKLYGGLKASTYGSDIEVAKLGMQLARLKHIQMFNN